MHSVWFEKTNEISQELDCGMRVYLHKQTGELVVIPNHNDICSVEWDAWQEETALLKSRADEYHEIEKWPNTYAFQIMKDFTEELTGNGWLKDRLHEALHNKKPFREFKHIIDDAGTYRQRWFDYKNSRQQEYVEQQLRKLLNPGR